MDANARQVGQERTLWVIDCIVYGFACLATMRFAMVVARVNSILTRALDERNVLPTNAAYPEYPLASAFWIVLVLFSPSIALLFFSGLHWSVSTVANMLVFPKVYALQLILERKYHLSSNGDMFLPFAIAIITEELLRFAYWVRAVIKYHRVGRERIRRMFVEERRSMVSPLFNSVSSFNKYQLRSIVLAIRDLISDDHTDPTTRTALQRRLTEVELELAQRPGPYVVPPACAQCVACFDLPAAIQLHPCGHAPLCSECLPVWSAAEARQGRRYPLCPQCRTEVLSNTYKRVYERDLLAPAEYARQTRETTQRELFSLYSTVKARPWLANRLSRCPDHAFHSRLHFDMTNDPRTIKYNADNGYY